ncbi:MAG: triose-phosphate isomerase [Coleofasciculaceae cyanobacterium SM2_1_6]|nr:triose-phosphate isomerase [Coleofasciculaceae cyanobacterium SM2_1_6]
MRQNIIAGNWKMHKTVRDASEFLQEFLPHLEHTPEDREVVLCIPATSLWPISKSLHGSRIRLGAQNVHWAEEGAFTGEISPAMLTEIGVRYVLVGHSEPRQYCGETDEAVNKRSIAAQKAGLTPILCLGETKEQRDNGETEDIIISQVEQGLPGVDLANLVIAYEPIWAIGTGETCEVHEANRVIGLIRSQLDNPDVPIQYGGSVKPALINEIMEQPEIDGVLVGGASLVPEDFAKIVNYF